jgi:meiotically up-regulated gene 157 (Mug157) protein
MKASFATGMIKTGFRPSDDANDQPYNIPGNAMMVSYL